MTQVAQSTMGAPDPELNLPTDKALDVEGVKTMDLDETPWTEKDQLRMWKNVVVIGFGFMFLFTAFQNMAALQSSINPVDGLGTYTLALIYTTIILSCLFLPTLFITKLGAKKTLVLCQLMYTGYVAAQFYPTWGTLIPASAILGLAAAPMWSAKCTYLSQMGTFVAKRRGVPSEPIINKFFGIFFLLFQTWGIWGNLVSSTVLKSDAEFVPKNKSELAECAANYSNGASAPADPIADNKLYTLAGTYMAFALVGPLIILLFLDPLENYGEAERKQGSEPSSFQNKSGWELVKATLSHLFNNRYQKYIFPLTIWSGLEQGFLGAGFTKAYITCPVGVQNIGYILIAYAVTDAICSFSFGWILKRVGRIPIFTIGAVLNIVVMIVCLLWTPTEDYIHFIYILAVLWGMSDAIWQTQINAFYGVMFVGNEEPAFANYRLWESLGFVFIYLIDTNMVMRHEIYIMLVALVLGFIGYLLIEHSEMKRTGKWSLRCGVESSSK